MIMGGKRREIRGMLWIADLIRVEVNALIVFGATIITPPLRITKLYQLS